MSPDATRTASPPAGLLQQVGDLVSELLTHDGWSRERLLAYQTERLRALLEHAVGHSRYYRSTLGADAADRPLTDLPTLSKADLMDNFDDIVTDPRLRRTDLEAHLAGPDPARSYLDEYRVLTTSGTTAARHLRRHRGRGHNLDRRQRALGDPRRDRAAVPDDRDRHSQSVAPHPAAVRPAGRRPGPGRPIAGRPPPPNLSAATPLPELVAALNAYQPEVLLGYPSVAGLLADEQLAGRLHISLKSAGFGAEPLTPNLRSRIRAAWGFEPVSIYAATESPVIASSTPSTPSWRSTRTWCWSRWSTSTTTPSHPARPAPRS